MEEYGVVLEGGTLTAVVRVGDTVRRGPGPWTPTIHAFMRHLRAAGFALVAQTLRAFHDASLGFAFDEPQWQWPAHEPAEVICHNDFGPYNLMFEDGFRSAVRLSCSVSGWGPG